MSLLVRAARVGAGVGVVVAAAVVLSACTGQASSSGAAPSATTSSPVTTPGKQVDACSSATKSVLLAAVKANKELAGSLVIDGKGLQDIKCSASVDMALAGFSNNLDGGSVLFRYQHGSWVATTGGTDVCSDLPAATQKQICD